MEGKVRELCEEFLMSEVCSEYYGIDGQDTDAQDLGLYLRYMEDARQCQQAAQACRNYLQNNNFEILLCELRRLELTNSIKYLTKYMKN